MAVRGIVEEFLGLLKSLGVTGQKRVDLDDTLRLNAALADYRHFRPRLNAQVCFMDFDTPGVVGEFAHVWIEKADALAIWPLEFSMTADGDFIMYPGGIDAASDNDTSSGTANPVGSKGLVSQSRWRRGSIPAVPTANGVYMVSDLVGGTRARFSFPQQLGAWVYQPEASEFGPSLMHFLRPVVAANFHSSVAWLEVRSG